MMTVLASGVVLFGAVFINRGLIATGSPVTFLTVQTALVGTGGNTNPADYVTAADGVVEIPVVIENTQFSPQVVQIPADTPVRLVVDRRESGACSDQIYLPQLGVLADLTPNGVTAVDIPATAAGSYTLTCGMSMMSGQLVVGSGSGGGPFGTPTLWIVLALAGAIGALVVSQRRDARMVAAAKDKKHTQQSAAKTAELFGFTPFEIVIIIAAVAAAILAGLSFGGSFN